MKKLLSAFLLLSFISWNSVPDKPVVENTVFNPLYYKIHHMTPLFVILARPETSSEIGISANTQVWTSERIDATTFRCSGMRSSIRRVPDSSFQKDMYGKQVVVHFDQMITEWDYRVWSDHIICSGSGTCSVTGQGTYVSGDRALIVAGSYTGGGFTQIKGVTFIPQTAGHTVFFTGEIGWRGNNDSCELAYISFVGISGSAIDMRAYDLVNNNNKPIKHSYLHNLYFSGVTGACIDANGGIQYADSNSAEWLDVAFDSINEDQCGLLVQGSFGSPTDNAGHPPGVWVRPSFTRFISTGTTSTTNRGTEARGIMFELIASHIIMIDTSGLGNSGDCGIFYGHGSGVESFVIKIGPGPGYIWRLAPTREIGRPGIDWFFNNYKFNTTDYGQNQIQNPDTITAKFGCVDEVWYTHNTAGRMLSDNNYWCQGLVMGDLNCTAGPVFVVVHVKNNFCFEVTDHASGGVGHDGGSPWKIRICFNMGTGASAMDTSNNQYFPLLSQAGVDTTTTMTVRGYTFPLMLPKVTSAGNLVTGGIAVPISTTDYYGNAYGTIIGYAAIPGAGPAPCNPCTVFPGFKYTLKHL